MITIQKDSPPLKILDLGCGKKKRSGAIGVDYSDRHNADVIHDLNKLFTTTRIFMNLTEVEFWKNYWG